MDTVAGPETPCANCHEPLDADPADCYWLAAGGVWCPRCALTGALAQLPALDVLAEALGHWLDSQPPAEPDGSAAVVSTLRVFAFMQAELPLLAREQNRRAAPPLPPGGWGGLPEASGNPHRRGPAPPFTRASALVAAIQAAVRRLDATGDRRTIPNVAGELRVWGKRQQPIGASATSLKRWCAALEVDLAAVIAGVPKEGA